MYKCFQIVDLPDRERLKKHVGLIQSRGDLIYKKMKERMAANTRSVVLEQSPLDLRIILFAVAQSYILDFSEVEK
jgi:hypothetical protein